MDDDFSPTQRCELSLEGCNPDCLQSIAELCLHVMTLQEDGQLKGLSHKLRIMKMAIEQPRASNFDMSTLRGSHWATSQIDCGESFVCILLR